jgi:hypothetical protein
MYKKKKYKDVLSQNKDQKETKSLRACSRALNRVAFDLQPQTKYTQWET